MLALENIPATDNPSRRGRDEFSSQGGAAPAVAPRLRRTAVATTRPDPVGGL
jgi:hypothetical protein